MVIEELKRKIADKHLKLNPPLSNQEIAEFEEKHNISLPKGYRDFLLNIGNGGDGPPYYKLLPLGKAASDANKVERDIWENFIYIEKEFPFTESWCWENENNETEEFEKKLESAYFGSIMLGTDGCGMNWLLIVNGRSSGKIWQITEVGIVHCTPKMNFIEWYEYWLKNGENASYFE